MLASAKHFTSVHTMRSANERGPCALSDFQKYPSTGTMALPAEATQCRYHSKPSTIRDNNVNVRWLMSTPSDAINFNFSVPKMMTIPAFALKFSLTFITCRKLRVCACVFQSQKKSSNSSSSSKRTARSSLWG